MTRTRVSNGYTRNAVLLSLTDVHCLNPLNENENTTNKHNYFTFRLYFYFITQCQRLVSTNAKINLVMRDTTNNR